jgi:hypothetical protein
MAAPAEVFLAQPPEGIGLYMQSQKVRIADGTERLRGYLKPNPLTGVPKIVFSPSCKGILSEFGAEPNPFDGQTRAYVWKTDAQGNVIGENPDDKWNHGIKAVIYGLINNFGYAYIGSQKLKQRVW